jgi:hypothetical protein
MIFLGIGTAPGFMKTLAELKSRSINGNKCPEQAVNDMRTQKEGS